MARSATDLKLLHDAALSSEIPFVHLAKVKRAQAEIKNLLSEIEARKEAAPP